MSSKTTPWFATLALAGLAFAQPAVAADNDSKPVLAANAQFYAALNQMFTGDVAPMKEVWSHAADVNYMGPSGGLTVGWSEVAKVWDAQAALKLGGKVEAQDLQVFAGEALAVVSNFEKGENTNAKGETQTVSIRATNVFRKEDGKWKMVGHHTDLLPYLQN